MSEEIDKHVFRKYEIQSKLGKGVRCLRVSIPVSLASPCLFPPLPPATNAVLGHLLQPEVL